MRNFLFQGKKGSEHFFTSFLTHPFTHNTPASRDTSTRYKLITSNIYFYLSPKQALVSQQKTLNNLLIKVYKKDYSILILASSGCFKRNSGVVDIGGVFAVTTVWDEHRTSSIFTCLSPPALPRPAPPRPAPADSSTQGQHEHGAAGILPLFPGLVVALIFALQNKNLTARDLI